MKNNYKNVYGTWSVTTEGDVEGRTTINLGTYKGYVDEIALHLADKCYYSLCFKKMSEEVEYVPKATSVNVMFDIESGTWEGFTKGETGLGILSNCFEDRPVVISQSNYFASFTITSKNAKEIQREMILSKLTPEERKILGL